MKRTGRVGHAGVCAPVGAATAAAQTQSITVNKRRRSAGILPLGVRFNAYKR
jgi:hypothetical protein